MNLVTSLGGPLIVVPHGALSAWEGADQPADSRVDVDIATRMDPKGPPTDYDRACAIAGAGIVSVGDAEALVISNEALNAVWLPANREGRGNVFLCQLSMDDEARFQASIMMFVDRDFPPSKVVWTVTEPHLRLFDAAMAGTDILTPWEDIVLMPATYEVRTMPAKIAGVAEVILIKLVQRD